MLGLMILLGSLVHMMIHYSDDMDPSGKLIVGQTVVGVLALLGTGCTFYFIRQSQSDGEGMTDYLSLMKAKLAALDEERRRLMAAIGVLDEVDSDALRAIQALPASQQRAAYREQQSQSDGE